MNQLGYDERDFKPVVEVENVDELNLRVRGVSTLDLIARTVEVCRRINDPERSVGRWWVLDVRTDGDDVSIGFGHVVLWDTEEENAGFGPDGDSVDPYAVDQIEGHVRSVLGDLSAWLSDVLDSSDSGKEG